MKLENLKSGKFKKNTIKSEQMFKLNGGGEQTGGGCNHHGTQGGREAIYDYAYDSVRNGRYTFHGRTAVHY